VHWLNRYRIVPLIVAAVVAAAITVAVLRPQAPAARQTQIEMTRM